MNKEILTYNDYRLSGIRLAAGIHQHQQKDANTTDWFPNIIMGVLRGGVELANIISEYYKYKFPNETIYLGAVAASSYKGVGNHSRVDIHGWTIWPEWIHKGDKVMLVDDIWDSGNTLDVLLHELLLRGLSREDIKVVVYATKHTPTNFDNKFYPCYDPPQSTKLPEDQIEFTTTNKGNLSIPDYWYRRIDKDAWINFPHELVGTTDEERNEIFGENVWHY